MYLFSQRNLCYRPNYSYRKKEVCFLKSTITNIQIWLHCLFMKKKTRYHLGPNLLWISCEAYAKLLSSSFFFLNLRRFFEFGFPWFQSFQHSESSISFLRYDEPFNMNLSHVNTSTSTLQYQLFNVNLSKWTFQMSTLHYLPFNINPLISTLQ